MVPNKSAPKRIYYLDLALLQHLSQTKYAYSTELAPLFNRAKRTIQRHLTKLEHLNLVERVGSPRCPFQWWKLNDYDIEGLMECLNTIAQKFKAESGNYVCWIELKNLLVGVRKGQLRIDPSRPFGRSTPYWLSEAMKNFYAFLKHHWGFTSPNLPQVLITKLKKDFVHLYVMPLGKYKKNLSFFLTKEQLISYPELQAERMARIAAKKWGTTISFI